MLRLGGLFSDHMVFQRNIPLPVWGWTKPDAIVLCRCGGVEACVGSRSDGAFTVVLPCLEEAENLTLEVESAGERIALRGVAVGEVWLASGQSNMEFPPASLLENDAAELEKRDWSKVRMFDVEKCARFGGSPSVSGSWAMPERKHFGRHSAVALYFAGELAQKLGCTVGVIHSSWGGTIAEAWSSREALLANPETRPAVKNYESRIFAPATWENYAPNSRNALWLERIVRRHDALTNHGEAKGFHSPQFDDSELPSMPLPGRWNQQGEPYNGVLWFRRRLTLPETWAGNDLVLRPGMIDKHDITYFNGVEVGRTGKDLEWEHWDKPRTYRVPGELVRGGENLLAIRAFSFCYDCGLIGPADEMLIYPENRPEEAIRLDGDYRYAVECNIGWSIAHAEPSPGEANYPYALYSNMIAPLIPYGIKGVIWYQGESNAGSNFSGTPSYRRLMRELIFSWRRAWGQGDFPFYQVQLANWLDFSAYCPGEAWPLLREAQNLAAADTGNACAIAIDAGERSDIHPKDKRRVGLRLAALALRRDYRLTEIAAYGPEPRQIEPEGSGITVYFDHCEGGLRFDRSAPGLFYIAGADGVFSEAKIDARADSVHLSAGAVPNPLYVRYAWSNNPGEGALLYNAAGLPASPFRTDTFKN